MNRNAITAMVNLTESIIKLEWVIPKADAEAEIIRYIECYTKDGVTKDERTMVHILEILLESVSARP